MTLPKKLLFLFFMAACLPNLSESAEHNLLNQGLKEVRLNDVIYMAQNQEIKRYDLSSSSWLSAVSLNSGPDAFNVNPHGIFVAHGNELYEYSASGAPRTLVYTNTDPILEVVYLSDHLIFATADNTYAFDLLSQTLTSEIPSGVKGLVAVPGRRHVFAIKVDTIPRDIVKTSLSEAGVLDYFRDSNYHGNYPQGERMYTFPDERRVVDASGIVYFTVDMTFSADLQGSFSHLDFYGDLPIVLRNGELSAYSNTFEITGSYTPQIQSDFFYVYNDEIHAFSDQGNDFLVETFDISLLTSDIPFQAIDPTGLQYEPYRLSYDNHQTVYLLDRPNLSIYPYDVGSESYQDTISLENPPTEMEYSVENSKLYLTVANNSILEYDPASKEMSVLIDEDPYLNFANNYLHKLEMAGEYLLVLHYLPISFRGFSLFDHSGTLIASQDIFESTDYLSWDSGKRIMYFYHNNATTGAIRGIEINEAGEFGDEIIRNQSLFFDPVFLCTSPDGDLLVQSRGYVLETDDYEVVEYLPHAITDCSWSNGTLYTLEDAGTLRLQSWSENFEETLVTDLFAAPLGMQGLTSGAVFLMYKEFDGVPQFSIENDVIFNNHFEQGE